MTEEELRDALQAISTLLPRDEVVRAMVAVPGGLLMTTSSKHETADYFREVAEMIEQHGEILHKKSPPKRA